MWVLAKAEFPKRTFRCSYCDSMVGPSIGYQRQADQTMKGGYIYVCPICDAPTFFYSEGKQFPGRTLGDSVSGITDKEVETMYSEARKCASIVGGTRLRIRLQSHRGRNILLRFRQTTTCALSLAEQADLVSTASGNSEGKADEQFERQLDVQ